MVKGVGLDPASNTGKIPQNTQERRLREACQEFEAIFYQQVLQQMRATVGTDDWLGGGMGEDVFRDMLDGEYAKLMAEKNTGGLADLMYRQLTGQIK